MEVTQAPWCRGTGGVDPAGVLEPRPCSKGPTCVWQCLITPSRPLPKMPKRDSEKPQLAPPWQSLRLWIPSHPHLLPNRPGRGRGQSSLTSFKEPSSQSGTGWCSGP